MSGFPWWMLISVLALIYSSDSKQCIFSKILFCFPSLTIVTQHLGPGLETAVTTVTQHRVVNGTWKTPLAIITLAVGP